MSMSGITPTEECITSFNDMQINKKHGYIIMSIMDKKKVVVEEKGDPFSSTMTQAENEAAFNELKKRFLANELEPKFLLFDFKMDTKDGRREKIAFVNWCSDNCGIHKKTLQGSTSEGLKKVFQGLAAAIQANDSDELSYDSIAKELEKK